MPVEGPEVARLFSERGTRLISLDLDDTIVDTDAAASVRLDAAVDRARELLPHLDTEAFGRAHAEALAANPVVGGRMPALMAVLGLEVASEHGTSIRAAYNSLLPDALELVDGAVEVIRRLRERYTVAILTNGPAQMQWPKVRRFNLEAEVDHVVVSGDVGFNKPDPRVYQHLLREAGVEARHGAHVGDAIASDVRGALAAGMLAVWYPPALRDPEPVDVHVPDAVINRLEDLLGPGA